MAKSIEKNNHEKTADIVVTIDVGREEEKTALSIIIGDKNKTITLKRPTKIIQINPDIYETPDNCISIEVKDSTSKKIQYFSLTNESSSKDGVVNIIDFTSDELLLENLSNFVCIAVARAIKSLIISAKKEESIFNIFTSETNKIKIKNTLIYIPLTKDMYLHGKNQLYKDFFKNNIVTIKLHRGNAIKNRKEYVFSFTFNKDTVVLFNPQGSYAINYYLYDMNTQELITNIKKSSEFIETEYPTIYDKIRDNNMTDILSKKCDYIHIDLSSTEMTVSLNIKGNASFNNTYTMRIGSRNIYILLQALVNNISKSNINISKIKYLHIHNGTINTYGSSETHSVYKLFNEVYKDKVEETFFNTMSKEIKNLISLVKNENFDPKFFVLSGGGMLSINKEQSVYMDVIYRLCKEFIDTGLDLTDEKACLSYVLPHGLSTNGLVVEPAFINAHSLGTNILVMKHLRTQK